MDTSSAQRPLASEAMGCGHCLTCKATCTYTSAAAQRSTPGSSYLGEFHEWFGPYKTPTLYFLVHGRRLQHAVVTHARDPKVWRESSSEAPVPSTLRSQRALPSLAVKLPRAATNISPEDTIKWTGTVRLQLSPGKPPAPGPGNGLGSNPPASPDSVLPQPDSAVSQPATAGDRVEQGRKRQRIT